MKKKSWKLVYIAVKISSRKIEKIRKTLFTFKLRRIFHFDDFFLKIISFVFILSKFGKFILTIFLYFQKITNLWLEKS